MSKRDFGAMTDRQWFWYSVRTFYLPMTLNILGLCACMAVAIKWIM